MNIQVYRQFSEGGRNVHAASAENREKHLTAGVVQVADA